MLPEDPCDEKALIILYGNINNVIFPWICWNMVTRAFYVLKSHYNW